MYQTPRLPTRVSAACDRCRRKKQRVGGLLRCGHQNCRSANVENFSAMKFDRARCAYVQMQNVRPIGDHLQSM
jgi:cell fate regulator YaaT (PSP1 superfamily)